MKKIALLCILLTGCSTVYKVDSNGVCHAPSGKVVEPPKHLDKASFIMGDFFNKLFPDGYNSHYRNPYFMPWGPGSAFGGFYGSPAGA